MIPFSDSGNDFDIGNLVIAVRAFGLMLALMVTASVVKWSLRLFSRMTGALRSDWE